ncbi:MAG: TlpA family protein disulfide reductase [Chloroflexi bacterium]|nr:TlpA family protein disulfide reductase [Chloroflexota bacterium]
MTHAASTLALRSRTVRLYAAALVCFGAGLLILITAGLPDRTSATALALPAEGRAVAAEAGALAPPVVLTSSDGQTISLDELRGQVVVLNFWATWCAPCRVEMPELQKVSEKLTGQVTVLGINTGEPADQVRAWGDRYGLTFPLLLDTEGTAARDYRLRGQPTTVIVAPDGVIHAILYGPVDAASMEQTITSLLNPSTERTAP